MRNGMSDKKKIENKLDYLELTFQEWQKALVIPTPHKNKKKYTRKKKHIKNLEE